MHIEPKIIWTNLTLCMDIQVNLDKVSQMYQIRGFLFGCLGFFTIPPSKEMRTWEKS